MKFATVSPSSSYRLRLPDTINEDVDGAVSSYWLDGSPLLLQLSSYLRREGEQVSAAERLLQRKGKHQGRWSARNRKMHPDPNVDQATAEYIDADNLVWIHTYLVWPHLAIYALLSGPQELVSARDNWALQGIRSIELIKH